MTEKKDKNEILNVDYTEYETTLPENFFKRKKWKKEDLRQVKAFIPAVIIKVLVKPGDEIEEGQTLLIMEAMKMNNNVSASISGKVSSVSVKPGDRVVKDQLLIRLS